MVIYKYIIEKKEEIYSSINKLLVPILIFLILFAPTTLKIFKIGLIGLFVSSTILLFGRKMGLILEKKIIIWILVYSIFNLFFLIRGTFNNPSIFLQLLPTNVVWPLLYGIILIIPMSSYVKVDLSKTFLFSLIAIELFLLYIYLNYIGILPNSILLNLPLGQSINYNFGYINFFVPNMTSLFFLLPFFISFLLVKKNDKKNIFLIVMLIILGILLSLITGRRTLIALVGASPIISLLFMKISTKTSTSRKFIKLIPIMVVIIVVSIFFLTSVNTGLRLNNLETQLVSEGDAIRTAQFFSLIDGWKAHPILGAGLGVNAEIVRSQVVPGAYELTYVAKLFQTGIVGLSLYLLQLYWIIKTLLRFSRTNKTNYELIIPLLTGFSSLLIADSTNPYLSSFDGLWIIFYALAVVNRFLIEEKQVTNYI